ncbi:HupE/UreJ family protein [Portibacter marinus]|uniref:HupE/UreJ family protein n=1 Tax=Portibacter marinus TaxID=2898660 RepID=UPI001F1718C5|nr:HupE/UreJ family protein [Portibacter marinus]
MNKLNFITLFVFYLLSAMSLHGHTPDHSYLVLKIYGDAIDGRVEMTSKDMNRALGINLPDRMSLEDVMPYMPQLTDYFQEKLKLSSGQEEYQLQFLEPTVLALDEMEDFVRFHFNLNGVSEVPDQLDIDYNILLDQYPRHRGALIVEYNWKAGIVENEALISLIFTPNNRQQSLDLTSASLWKGFVALVRLGIWHIWIGLDHILFIIALILPAVVYRKKLEDGSNKMSGWIPEPKFKPAFIYIIKIVTFFTIAHSITLALASLNIVNLPSRIVESIIAISIALAAFHNITPVFKGREWLIAFIFGLFHGFGFASVLGEKGLSGDFMALSLLGFNLGVELGQLAIIIAVFPLLFLIRKTKAYKHILLYGSIILIIISIYWFIERFFNIDLPAGAYFYRLLALFGGS